MKEVYNFLNYIETLDYITFMIVFMLLVIVIDIISVFRYYYYNMFYNYISFNLDMKRLKYRRDLVISGYKTLASKEIIDKAISKVRSLEEKLNEENFNFNIYKDEYLKQLEHVRDRGYL